jgi:hypothetical protein
MDIQGKVVIGGVMIGVVMIAVILAHSKIPVPNDGTPVAINTTVPMEWWLLRNWCVRAEEHAKDIGDAEEISPAAMVEGVRRRGREAWIDSDNGDDVVVAIGPDTEKGKTFYSHFYRSATACEKAKAAIEAEADADAAKAEVRKRDLDKYR